MAQRQSGPDLTGMSLEANSWYSDESQRVDLELIFGDELQYCFTAVSKEPLILSFIAHSFIGEDGLRSHSALLERTVPREVCEWVVGETLAQLEHGVDTCRRYTISGIDTTEYRGEGDEDVPEHEVTTFEVDGDLGSQAELTAFEIIHRLANGTYSIVQSDEGGSQ